MAGLKGEGGRTGEWEGFSSLTPTRLDLCSYRQTQSTFTYKKSIIKNQIQHFCQMMFSALKLMTFPFNICVSLSFNWL